MGRNGSDVSKFEGIILIDELELHLHPVWQSKILKSLKNIFPAAQFIVTTHSPHVVQSADCGEILPLEVGEAGQIQTRNVPNLPHGVKMWTVEEVLEDIMGMEDSRTEVFNGFMRNFENAVAIDDKEEALKIYNNLKGSLNLRNPIGKILALQIANIGEMED